MKKLENKVSIITGAGSGLGKAIAILFASEGSKIIATDIDESRLDDLYREVSNNGGEISTFLADVSREEEVSGMIETAIAKYGTLDILINNAGVMDDFSPVGDVNNVMWNKVMQVNLYGPFYAMREAIPLMLKKGAGNIINISSIGGLQGARAGAAYTTSKHALIGLTKNTGYMYSKTGIRCNAIAPGGMETNITEGLDLDNLSPIVNDRIMAGMPLNPRMSDPMEVARVALFLASDDASFVNGAVIVADGGWIAY